MCVVSNVGDDWSRRERWPHWPNSVPFPNGLRKDADQEIRELKVEIAKLKAENKEIYKAIEGLGIQMKEALEAARAEDVANGTPDCEMEDKVVVLKMIAELLGLNLTKVFPK